MVKKRFCEEILDLLSKLQTEECTLKGFLCYELYQCKIVLNKLNSNVMLKVRPL